MHEDSKYHWDYLKALFNKLDKLPVCPSHYINMMGELQDFLVKHSKVDSGEDQVDIEGKDLFKYKGER